MHIRPMLPSEYPLLKTFLYEALFVPEGAEPFPKDIIYKPELVIYYKDFGTGRADRCLVAEEDGKVVGAAWTRLMHDYGYVDDETPSFSISLLPEYRGQGIGTQLLQGILDLMKSEGYQQVSLSCQKANRAVQMYRRAGFAPVWEDEEEYVMVCKLKTIHVVAAIIRDGDRIFATQRGYGPYKDGWEFPGGKIEAGETPEAALRREIREELDTDIAVGKMLMRVQYDYPEFHLDMQCFWATVVAGDLRLKEHEAARWLPLADLWQVDWLPADRLVVEELNKEQSL